MTIKGVAGGHRIDVEITLGPDERAAVATAWAAVAQALCGLLARIVGGEYPR